MTATEEGIYINIPDKNIPSTCFKTVGLNDRILKDILERIEKLEKV